MSDPVKPLDDAALREIKKISGVVATVPTVSLNGVELTFGHFRSSALVNGIDPVEGEKLGVRLESGRYLNRGDDQVIVLGYKLPEHFQVKAKVGNKGRKIGGSFDQRTSAEEEFEPFQGNNKAESREKNRVNLLHKTVNLSLRKLNTDEETRTVRLRVVGIMAETGGSEDSSAVIPLKMAGDLVKWQDGVTGSQKQRL